MHHSLLRNRMAVACESGCWLVFMYWDKTETVSPRRSSLLDTFTCYIINITDMDYEMMKVCFYCVAVENNCTVFFLVLLR